MNIIIVGPAYPIRGGIADTNEALCRAMIRKGHDCRIVSFSLQYPDWLFPGTTQYSQDAPPDGIDIITQINSIHPLNWYVSAKRIARYKPDVVIFRFWLPFMGMSLGTIARRLPKDIQKIALCDNVIPHERRFGDLWLTKYFVKPFNGFITLSEKVGEELKTYTDKPRMSFPHPINDRLGERVDRSEAASYLNLDPDDRYILFFGLVREYKGVDLLISALSTPAVTRTGVKLLVVGEFYQPISLYEDMIRKLSLEDRVILINQFIPSSEIKYYFSLAELVGQTYKSASQSGVTQVAFNFDVPVLTTNVGGLAETILHGETGYVVSTDVQDIADAIVDFYNRDRYNVFSENVREHKRKYSWDTFVDRFESFCKEINA